MRITDLTLCLCFAILFAAGCADSSQEPDPESVPEAASASTPAETLEAQIDTLGSLDDLLPEEFAGLTDSWTGDLDGMLERHVIRTLVVGGGPQFFYFNGKPRGIVTELLVELQAEINDDLDRRYRQLEVVPMPVSRDRLIPALVSGRADLIAADLTITELRSDLVDFSIPLVTNVDEIVVFAPGVGDVVQSIEDMSGRGVYVRRSSSYYEHLLVLNERLEAQGLQPVRVVEANELLRSQDVLEMVNAGMIGGTVIDSYKANYWSAIFPDMQVRNDLVVHAGGEIAWMFRKNSPLMKAAIDKFARGHRQGTLLGNVLIDRYMENLQWVRNSTSENEFQRLDPVLELFRSSGAEFGLDPLMLAAQAYQESGLDHERVSPVGARGVM
jgi:membrane-bound lytic murein transglycosylase MltF